jgi:hypothetical protein
MPDQGPAGVHHVADACKDIEPLMEIEHGWCHSLNSLDPNGIVVELCSDTPDAEGARSLFMATERRAAEKTISA